MTPDDWIAAGYKRFNTNSEKHSDFGLQKCIDDAKGKKYFITVYVYDNKSLPTWEQIKQHTKEYVFMPDVQFRLDDDELFFNVIVGGKFDIAKCESEIERLWVHFGKPYYEEFYRYYDVETVRRAHILIDDGITIESWANDIK